MRNESNDVFAARQVAANTKDHQLTVLRDDGLYRHLRCRRPGTGIWGWDVITWPGYLAVTGDLGSFTFCRQDDMLEFFTGPVNPGYWLEKCIAWSQYTHREGVVSLRLIEKMIAEDGDTLPDDVRDELAELDDTGHVSEAIRILMHRVHPDAWDWVDSITETDLHAARVLYLIAWTVAAYREHQQGGES